MKAQTVVAPTDFGVMGIRNGKERTAVLAARKFTLSDGAAQDLCPAAAYAKTSPDSAVVTDWFLPTPEHLASILGPVQHGTTASRDADALNRVLAAMGGDAVSNGWVFWSCVRRGAGYAWLAGGGLGFLAYSDMSNAYRSLPVSLCRLPEAIL